ncbi:MAG: heavy-metal-associated domain-containing protein [Actinobacteria bacterium]|nr:heavy-metal-associated domain-containing protein [Actinomycetota bacterium]
MTQGATLRIPALHSGCGVRTVTANLEKLPGVEVTETDPESKLVQLQFEESTISLEEIREALDQVGFSPEDEPKRDGGKEGRK